MPKIKGKILGKVTPLKLTQEQYDELTKGGLTTGQGGPQSTFSRIHGQVRVKDGVAIAHVTDRELDGLRTATHFPGGGGWQNWARAVLDQNNISY